MGFLEGLVLVARDVRWVIYKALCKCQIVRQNCC